MQAMSSTMHQGSNNIVAGPSTSIGERTSKSRRHNVHMSAVQTSNPSFGSASSKSIPIVKVTHEMIQTAPNTTEGHSHLTMGQTEVLLELTGQTGSLLYMPPEVYNEQPYNEKADVFSFAIVMYELLHRRTIMDHIIEMNPRSSATDEEMEHAIAVYAQMVANGHR